MKRLVALIAAASVAVFTSGCASDKEYLKAQADAATVAGNARVAEAQAKSDEAKAVIAVSTKLDAGGAAAYVLGLAFKGMGANQGPAPVTVQRPRDWLDYLEGGARAFSGIAGALTPWGLAIEQRRTTTAGYARDVQIEVARQGGESTRIGSVAQIARDVAASRPNTTTTISIGRDGTLGGSQSNDNSVVDRHDAHNCNGGAAATGGSGGAAAAGTATAPGGPGGSGAAGGSAPGGNC